MTHGPNEPGVIGREAGAALQRWPLDIYWLGMARWGIRCHPGSISSYFAGLSRPSPWRLLGRALDESVEGRRDEAADNIQGNWAPVPPPAGRLSPSRVLRDQPPTRRASSERRVVLTHPDSLSCSHPPDRARGLMSTAPPILGTTRRHILHRHRCGSGFTMPVFSVWCIRERCSCTT